MRVGSLQIGVNTYGLVKPLSADFDRCITRMKMGGVSHLEPCIMFPVKQGAYWKFACWLVEKASLSGGIWQYSEAGTYAARLRNQGMDVAGAHIFPIPLTSLNLEAIVPSLISCAKELGLRYYVISQSSTNPKKIREFTQQLRKAHSMLKAEGIELLLHNHDWEFQKLDDRSILDMVLDEIPELGLELDVGWAEFGGVGAIAAMEKYAERISIVHLKDYTADAPGDRKSLHFKAIGEGCLNLSSVLRRSEEMNLLVPELVIDQDRSDADILDDVIVGAQNICCLGKE